MAKLVKNIPGDFDAIVEKVTSGIMSGSISASL